MKYKKLSVMIAVLALILCLAIVTMAIIGNHGASSPVGAATKFIEASMRYDAKDMAYVSSDKQRQILYNTGEIPTARELIKALNKSYDGVPSGYEGKKITFTVADESVTNDTAYVKLNVYVDGNKAFTRECSVIKINGRWYYNGDAE